MTARQVSQRGVIRFTASGATPGQSDAVAVEEPLEIRISGEPVAVTMRTPGDDAQLVAGFLFAEGLIRSIDDLGTVAHCGRPGDESFGNVLDVVPAPGVSFDVDRLLGVRRGTLTTAACGVCGRKSIDDLLALCGRVPDGPEVEARILAAAPDSLRPAQRVFAQTGGTHAAAAIDSAGQCLALCEDVGRHNAVDKVVGTLLFARRLGPGSVNPAAILAVSGRTSFEIVQKAAMARFALVASVSAGSTLAIDLADRCGITLATFVRGVTFNVYTHPGRIKG